MGRGQVRKLAITLFKQMAPSQRLTEFAKKFCCSFRREGRGAPHVPLAHPPKSVPVYVCVYMYNVYYCRDSITLLSSALMQKCKKPLCKYLKPFISTKQQKSQKKTCTNAWYQCFNVVNLANIYTYIGNKQFSTFPMCMDISLDRGSCRIPIL